MKIFISENAYFLYNEKGLKFFIDIFYKNEYSNIFECSAEIIFKEDIKTDYNRPTAHANYRMRNELNIN